LLLYNYKVKIVVFAVPELALWGGRFIYLKSLCLNGMINIIIPSSLMLKEIFNLRFCNRDLYRKLKASRNCVPKAIVTRCLRLPITIPANDSAVVCRSVGG
jgi:hypothetical protein